MYDDYVLTNVLLALSYELRMHTQQSKPRNNQPSEQPATHKLCGIETQQSTTGINTQQSTTRIDTQQLTSQTKPTEHWQQTTINHPLILRIWHIFSIAVANVSTLQSTSNVSPLTNCCGPQLLLPLLPGHRCIKAVKAKNLVMRVGRERKITRWPIKKLWQINWCDGSKTSSNKQTSTTL